jgi:hypothetical protein
MSAVAPYTAEAQRRGGGIVVRSRRGGDWHSVPAPYRSDVPLFAPFSSGALERNFQIMRNTSPNPRLYMGGQLNPHRSGFQVGFGAHTNDFYLSGLYSSYDYGYGYGGYGYPAYGYGYGYPAVYYPPVPPTLYPWGYVYSGWPPLSRERVVIIQREREVPAPQTEPSDAKPAPRRETPRNAPEYYLDPSEGRASEGLVEALLEIRKAWLNGDYERLRARIRDGSKVRIYPNGAYKYSVSAADFGQMTRDAMSRMDTLSFELDAPRTLSEGRAFVSGKHVYKDADGEKRTANISYVLARVEGRWYIVEAGSSSSPISRHVEEASR